jgi:hypothetical protein
MEKEQIRTIDKFWYQQKWKFFNGAVEITFNSNSAIRAAL